MYIIFCYYCYNSLLSQYQFCAAGVGLGTAYAIKTNKKGAQGMLGPIIGGAVGSVADLVYGYTVACVTEREKYFARDSTNLNQGNSSTQHKD